jgi:glycosyltransferase involved in cell wall biosynthesis
MKIVLICTGYDYEFPHPACGGSEACTEKLALGMEKQNIDFTVICPRRINKGDYKFKILETESIPYRYDNTTRFQEEAVDIASKLNADIVLTQNPHQKLRELKSLVLITNHGGGDGKMGGDLFLDKDNIYYHFISKVQLERCLKNLPELKNKHFFAETSLIDEDFFVNKPENYFLWCASLFWGFQTKGLDLFITLASYNPNYNFYAYGMGSDEIEKFLKSEVEIKIPNFKFKGFLDRYTNHSEVFSKSLAYCQFSRLEESFGRTTIEALSKGVPVIHFGGGATPDLVQDNGILIKSQEELINCPQNIKDFDRNKIADYAKNRFHVNIQIEKIIKFYKEKRKI